MKRVYLMIVMLPLLCVSGFGQGHWEAEATPKLGEAGDTQTSPVYHAPIGSGTADATVTATGTLVLGEAHAYCDSIWCAVQNSASKGGSFIETFRWVGSGEGRAGCMGEVDTFASMDLYAAAAQSVASVRAESNVWDDPLSQQVSLSHASASAPNLGSVGLNFGWASVSLPIPSPGGHISESYTEDQPSENIYGEKCLKSFWHKRLTFGYVNVTATGVLSGSGYACNSVFGKVTSTPSLMGACEDTEKEVVVIPTTCTQADCVTGQATCTNMEVIVQ